MVDKKGPGHLMLKEIREQPQALSRLIDAEKKRIWEMAKRWNENPPRFISIAARGTSDHAALYGKYLFETVNGIPVALAAPSVTSMYKASLRVEGALFIGISQSGEAADVTAVIEQAKQAGADTLAITNVEGSPLSSAAQDTIPLHAGPERAVAATKTFTNAMAALLLLSAGISRDEGLLANLDQLPPLVEEAVQSTETEKSRDKIQHFRNLQECVVLGRGYGMSVAYELALKLRETSYLRAQPFASPDFVHGPIAIIREGYPVIAIANQGAVLDSVMEVVKEVQSRGAEAIIIGNAPQALEAANVAFPVNAGREVAEVISPFPSIATGQVFAQTLAVIKGFDPDNPHGLQKVTVTL